MKKIVPVFKPYFGRDEEEGVIQCLRSGWVAQGPQTAEFEELVAAHEGVAHAVATTSCTTALYLAMCAMGLSADCDILIPSFTFVATANTAELTGATAVLVDVRTDTYCLDIAYLKRKIEQTYTMQDGTAVNRVTGKKLFGIVPVSLFGLCADIPAVNEIAAEYGIKVLEDSACALGATINGVHEGAFGNPACLSFHARKSITTGEGGMIITDDAELAESMRKLRSHCASISEIARHQNHSFLMPNYDEVGYNFRMTDIQGAVGVAQMKKFDVILEKKRQRAARYDRLLPQAAPYLKIPTTPTGYAHTYQSYVVMVDKAVLGLDTENANRYRNKVMAYLEDNGISTRQGTHAVHMLGYYQKKYGYRNQDLPGAYDCYQLSIALPFYAGMTEDEQDYVLEYLGKASKIV